MIADLAGACYRAAVLGKGSARLPASANAWNSAVRPKMSTLEPRLLIDRILHFAHHNPSKTAITRNGEKLSYRQFAHAIASARNLFSTTPIDGSVVGVAIWDLSKSWVCSLALRSLGFTTLPIRSPDALQGLAIPELKCVVGNATWSGLEQRCHAEGLRLLPIPPSHMHSASVATELPHDGGHILLTSGTTGHWKMVFCDATAVKAAMKWGQRVNEHTVYHAFDYGPWTGAGARIPMLVWYHGGEIVFQQGEQFERHLTLRNLTATDATLTPLFLDQILTAPEGAFPFNESLTLYIGGGTITASQIKDAKRRICPTLVNHFASTEVAGIACTRIEEVDDQRWHVPLPERGVEIVDERDEKVAVGQPGRLRVPIGAGPRGYLNDPEATAASFRDGFFYPGDLAVQREDGRFSLQGRTTEVINIAGSKFAPGPHEDFLRERFRLSGICLISAPDKQGKEILYAVIEAPEGLDEDVLASICNAIIDVPLNVITIAALPRTGSGKVVRREVNKLVLASVGQSGSSERPFAGPGIG